MLGDDVPPLLVLLHQLLQSGVLEHIATSEVGRAVSSSADPFPRQETANLGKSKTPSRARGTITSQKCDGLRLLRHNRVVCLLTGSALPGIRQTHAACIWCLSARCLGAARIRGRAPRGVIENSVVTSSLLHRPLLIAFFALLFCASSATPESSESSLLLSVSCLALQQRCPVSRRFSHKTAEIA